MCKCTFVFLIGNKKITVPSFRVEWLFFIVYVAIPTSFLASLLAIFDCYVGLGSYYESNKVLGYPLIIFDCVSGSGSYLFTISHSLVLPETSCNLTVSCREITGRTA